MLGITCFLTKELHGISGIGQCSSLNVLHLSFCTELVDISGVSTCQQLHTIDLRGCTRLVNISWLAKCPLLSRIELRGCDVGNLEASSRTLLSRYIGAGAVEYSRVVKSAAFDLD